MKNKISQKALLLLGGYFLFVLVVPFVLNDYLMTVIDASLIYFIVALGLSIMLGMGGQMNFSSVSFMGLAAFLSVQISNRTTLSVPVSMLIAIVITCVLAFALGFILFRLKGAFFAFATIGLVQIFTCIFTNYVPLSGGPTGTYNVRKLEAFGYTFSDHRAWFYLLAVIGILCALLVERIRKTSLGRGLASVRDNEITAQSFGINVYLTKVIGFTISSALAAIGGVMIAHMNGIVSQSMFTFNTATNFVVMVMLGGVNSTSGAFIGTLLVTLLPEWLRPLKNFQLIFFGIMLVLLMRYMPMGIAGLADKFYKKYLKKKKTAAVKEGK